MRIHLTKIIFMYDDIGCSWFCCSRYGIFNNVCELGKSYRHEILEIFVLSVLILLNGVGLHV